MLLLGFDCVVQPILLLQDDVVGRRRKVVVRKRPLDSTAPQFSPQGILVLPEPLRSNVSCLRYVSYSRCKKAQQ